MARHGQKLAALAERRQVALNFEASVCAGIPVVKTLREGLNGNSFTRIYGILNGTCNYILSRMEQDRLAFDDCLRDAQRLGYAEADPTFDVEGHDTAQKLSILASLAFGTKLDPKAIYVEGISSITLADLDAADELGYRVKLLGVAVKTEEGIEQRVHPTMVPKDSAIAQVMGVTNAVTVDAEGLAPITLVGPGAGGMATASAVVSDLADIARGVRTRAVRPPGRAHDRGAQGADAASRRRLLHPAAGARPAGLGRDHRAAAGATEHIAGIHRAASRQPARANGAAGPFRRAGAGDHDHLCDQRGCGAQGPRRRAPRPCNLGPAAGHSNREELEHDPEQADIGFRTRSCSTDGGARMATITVPASPALERVLSIEIARVTERAAVAAARLRGRGAEKKSDQAAVDAMRRELGKLPIDGTVVIGEGEMDEAPMLFIGEKVGTMAGPKVDIAVDPLEGTTLCAKNMPGAIATLAMADHGAMLHAPDIYMDKIGIGPGYPKNVVDLDAPADENILALAKAKGVKPDAITAMILDRPRHADIIAAVRKIGAAVSLITDGDVAGVIHTAEPDKTGIDIYLGIGGAPEGVLAAAALRCIGGQMQCRLVIDTDEKRERAAKMGIKDPRKKYLIEDMVRGDCLFAATGVTDGRMLRGVRFGHGVIETETVVMRSASGTVRRIVAEHRKLDKFE